MSIKAKEKILEMLELSVSKWPNENASFPHVSGMTFSVNTLGEAFERVYNVKILNSETGNYEDLVLEKNYTVASNNFILLECGDGMTMFEGAKVISDTGILDVEILELYINDHLGGVIHESYAEVNRRITFTEGVEAELPDAPKEEENNSTQKAPIKDNSFTIAIVMGGGSVAAIAVAILIDKKRRPYQK